MGRRPNTKSTEPVKRGRGRPRKTEVERVADRALAIYKDIEGDLDPSMALLPPNFTSLTRYSAMQNRVGLNRLFTAIRLGMPDRQACAMASISVWAVIEWKNKALTEIENRDKGDKPNHDMDDAIVFYAAYCAARYAPLASALDVVRESLEEDRNVDTARWLIERHAPEDYAPSRRVEVTGRDGGNITMSHVLSLPEHRMDMLEDAKRDEIFITAEVVENGYSETSSE